MSGSQPGVTNETLASISTPDRVESRLGTLEFDDGAPSATVPGKGWWTIFRLYSLLQSFFDKTWRPSEIEPI